jgi:cation:H+ antiporter
VGWTIRQSRREEFGTRQVYEQKYASRREVAWRPVCLQVSLVFLGLVMLTIGAKWLVDGASTIARLFGMGELLIGLTIVAVGTSLPEIAASALASWRGERDIAVGNIIGSNLFNILCVLGMSAAVSPQGVAVSTAALRLDIPVMIAVAIVCFPIFFTGQQIARWEGGLFLAYYLIYTLYRVLSESHAVITDDFGTVILAFVIPLTAVPLLISLLGALYGRRD